jgi:hypothetical protein
MTRFVATCLVLPLFCAAYVVTAQQTTSDKPEQSSEVEQTRSQHSPKTAIKPISQGHPGQAAAQESALHCQPPEIPVDVINGNQVLHTCFDPAQSGEETKTLPGQLQVEVINGSAENIQYFYGNGEDAQIEAMLNKPVVIGVQSGNTLTTGGNKAPLVTRVNSAATTRGAAVTNRISPRPKRPAYQPDMH